MVGKVLMKSFIHGLDTPVVLWPTVHILLSICSNRCGSNGVLCVCTVLHRLQGRINERLYEEEMEVVWDKGSSGLVFYTDASYWDQQEGGAYVLCACSNTTD